MSNAKDVPSNDDIKGAIDFFHRIADDFDGEVSWDTMTRVVAAAAWEIRANRTGRTKRNKDAVFRGRVIEVLKGHSERITAIESAAKERHCGKPGCSALSPCRVCVPMPSEQDTMAHADMAAGPPLPDPEGTAPPKVCGEGAERCLCVCTPAAPCECKGCRCREDDSP